MPCMMASLWSGPTPSEVEVRQGEETYLQRTPLQGVAGKVFQAVGGLYHHRCDPPELWCQRFHMSSIPVQNLMFL